MNLRRDSEAAQHPMFEEAQQIQGDMNLKEESSVIEDNINKPLSSQNSISRKNSNGLPPIRKDTQEGQRALTENREITINDKAKKVIKKKVTNTKKKEQSSIDSQNNSSSNGLGFSLPTFKKKKAVVIKQEIINDSSQNSDS